MGVMVAPFLITKVKGMSPSALKATAMLVLPVIILGLLYGACARPTDFESIPCPLAFAPTPVIVCKVLHILRKRSR
jgi:hypothetical protein